LVTYCSTTPYDDKQTLINSHPYPNLFEETVFIRQQEILPSSRVIRIYLLL